MHYCTLRTKGALVKIYAGHSKRTVTSRFNDTTIRSYEAHYVENVSRS